MEWIRPEEYRKILVNLYGSREKAANILQSINKIIIPFIKEYPDPKDWLETPITEKKTFRYNTLKELDYIICWCWVKKKEINKQYNERLIEYFNSLRNPGTTNYIKWAKFFNILLVKEIEIFKSIKVRTSGLTSLVIHCLIVKKEFRNFTKRDINLAKAIDSRDYSTVLLEKLQYKLQYIEKNPVKKREKRNPKSRIHPAQTWAVLKKHEVWGETIRDFYDYLILSEALEGYIQNVRLIFERLIIYLELKNLKDFSHFEYSDYLDLTDYLSRGVYGEELKLKTLSSYVGRVRKIFSWGKGRPLFPSSLDFPEDYWSGLIKEGKINYEKSEGLAFSSQEEAESVVMEIIEFKPKNEIEKICKLFWLIAISSPPRVSYILNLEYMNCLQPLPNEPEIFGMYSRDEDKAGNRYGQFPILDKLGFDAIKELENRVLKNNFKPIYNKKNERKYVHLFQLKKHPYRLTNDNIYSFMKKILFKIFDEKDQIIKASPHRFRTHLLTHIALKTGDINAVQIAAGHKNESMTRIYLRSKTSRNTLLYGLLEKYEKKEITGKFYFQLVSLLSSENTPVDQMLRSLSTNISIEEFLNKYGMRLDLGYCLSQDGCGNWYKCWGCNYFLLKKEEIDEAIKSLCIQIINLRQMIRLSDNFSYENSIAAGQMKTITLIVKRLMELGLTHEEIDQKVNNYFEENLSGERGEWNFS